MDYKEDVQSNTEICEDQSSSKASSLNVYTEDDLINKYIDVLSNLINSDTNIVENLDQVIDLFYNEAIIPQDAITQTGIIPFICQQLTEDLPDEIKERLFRLLTFFTCKEYDEVLTNSFFNFITNIISQKNIYLSYALICFLNLYSSPAIHEYIENTFDFPSLIQLVDPSADVSVIETVLQIFTIFTQKESIELDLADELANLALFALNSKHTNIWSPALFLIVNLLKINPEISEKIYSKTFVQTLNNALSMIEPEILCSAIDTCILLVEKDYDMSDLNLKESLISLITHQNPDVQSKIDDMLTLMISKYDDIIEQLVKEGFVSQLIDCFSLQTEGQIRATELVDILFQNASPRDIRRLIREKLHLVVFKWIDFEDPKILKKIIPILTIVYSEAQNGGRLDQMLEEFDENEGIGMFNELLENTSNDEEIEAQINEFCNVFGILYTPP